MPQHIKEYIKNNVSLVYGYLEALDDNSNSQVRTVASSDSASQQGVPASEPVTPTIQRRQRIDVFPYNDPTASNGLFYPQTYPGTPTPRPRKLSNTLDLSAFQTPVRPITVTQAITDQFTGIPKPFVTPNMNLVRSIDHAKSNPSNDLRLKCPYPAPDDILIASREKYFENINTHQQKVAAGASPESNRVPFTIFEDDAIIRHMLEVSNDPSIPATEQRFEVVSQRLAASGMQAFRSKTAIKNMWCRVGRGRSGYDERKGVRKDSAHVVNGWKAKPGSKRKRFAGEDGDEY